MASPDVSILMPCFQAEPYIVAAVQSVLAQTFTAWELVIISDDRSDYQAFLAGQNSEDERIRYCSTGGYRTGISYARNTGLATATAPFITLLDADDFFMPQRLERMMPLARHHGVVFSGLTRFADNGVTALQKIGCSGKSGLKNLAQHWQENFSTQNMLVYDRTKLSDLRWREGYFFEDYLFILQCFDVFPSIYHLAEPLYGYRTHSGATTHVSNVEQMIDAKKRILQHMRADGLGVKNSEHRDLFEDFMERSLQAEETFAEASARHPGLLFEDHLQSFMRAPFDA